MLYAHTWPMVTACICPVPHYPWYGSFASSQSNHGEAVREMTALARRWCLYAPITPSSEV